LHLERFVIAAGAAIAATPVVINLADAIGDAISSSMNNEQGDNDGASTESGETEKTPIPGAADLVDDLAGQELIGEIEAGGGKTLDRMGDPKYDPESGTHDKVSKNRKNADGTRTELHADRNRETGKVDDAKIKQDAPNSRSKFLDH
jgi:hypothetical protein